MNENLLAGFWSALSTWKTYFATLLLAGVAAYVLTPAARRLAFRWGAVDQPHPRKVHARPMPRLGGLAVFGGFCFPWAGYYFLDNRVTATFQNYERLFLALMLGVCAMLALGVYDDLKGVRARNKFIIQMLVAVGLFFGGFRITVLSIPFGNPVQLGWLSLPVSVLWIVGVTNAINLLDGIDGLAAGVTACIALALALINMLAGSIMVALLTLCLAGACCGFLPHNFSPARIFLGDSGSLAIGMILACIGILSLFKAVTATFLAVPLVLFGLPLFDTASVMLGRVLRGASIFEADKTHVHHRLLALGLTQSQAAMFLYMVSAALGLFAITLSLEEAPEAVLVVGVLIVCFALVTWRAWRRRLNNHSQPRPTPPA
jgi:UDP-GlcNAc:undecaprenyl-phosphate GlcNAc-1-phosphate transferase